jgi:hypothetical protein
MSNCIAFRSLLFPDNGRDPTNCGTAGESPGTYWLLHGLRHMSSYISASANSLSQEVISGIGSGLVLSVTYKARSRSSGGYELDRILWRGDDVGDSNIPGETGRVEDHVYQLGASSVSAIRDDTTSGINRRGCLYLAAIPNP